MRQLISNDFVFSRNLLKVFTLLIAGGAISSVFLPTSKVLANYPSAYASNLNLSISREQCFTKAQKAANIVLSRVEKTIDNNGSLVLFGGTPVTTATLICSYNGQGSTFFVIVNGSYISDRYKEAESVRDQMGANYVKQLVLKTLLN